MGMGHCDACGQGPQHLTRYDNSGGDVAACATCASGEPDDELGQLRMLAEQYRNDMRFYPLSEAQRCRRIEWVNRVIGEDVIGEDVA